MSIDVRRATGVSGLLAVLLIFIPGIGMSTRGEPEFDGSAAEIMTFFRNLDNGLGSIESFVFTLGSVLFIVHAVLWGTLLATRDPAPAWRSRVVGTLGALALVIPLAGWWDAAIFRADDIDPQVARLAFDLSNTSFANAWVLLGGFALFLAWTGSSTGLIPRWSGWVLGLAGAGLVLSRAAWSSGVWIYPYLVFWGWILIGAIWLTATNDARRAQPT